MSSPNGVSGNNASVGIREGTRVILREITANLQNSPPGTSPRRKNGNEGSSNKADQQQHDVKVRFIREFADATVPNGREGIPETSSLSSASSFQSLASTLSSKCSSGICVDSSPSKNADRSYINADISGLDDLISACANIQLDDKEAKEDESFDLRLDSENNSPDETFRSATDRVSLDRTSESLLLNCTNPIDPNLNKTTEINHETSSKFPNDITDCNVNGELTARITSTNCSNDEICHFDPTNNVTEENVNLDLNVTTDIASENFTENLSSRENPDINVTTEITRENYTENRNDRENSDLNVTTEIARENITENHSVQGYPNLSVTTEITRENFTENPTDQENSDLNVTTDIATENITENRSAQGNPDLNITTEITRENFTENRSLQGNPDLNITTEITRENFTENRFVQGNPDLNVTTEITRENLTINTPEQVNPDLNVTAEITNENSTINLSERVRLDRDITRDLTSDDKPIETEFNEQEELERTRTIDGETEALLANADYEYNTVNRVENKRNYSELGNTQTETFVQCVSDIAQFTDLNPTASGLKNSNGELELAKTDVLEKNFISTSDKNVEQFQSNQQSSSDIIAPIFSQYRENLGFTQIERNDNSLLKTLTNLSIVEFKGKSLINESVDYSPSLPTLSSICLPADLNESINLLLPELPIQKIDKPVKNSSETLSTSNNHKTQDTPLVAPFISDKFGAIAGNELSTGNTLSNIQEPTFINAQSLLDNPTEIPDEKTKKLQISLTKNLEEIANSRVHEIDKVNSRVESTAETSKVETLSCTRNLESRDNNEVLNVEKREIRGNNVEIEKESFPEISEKQNDFGEDLDDTVTVEDLNTEDIPEIPENDQYAEFLPQKQSTALVPRDNRENPIVAGASEENFISRPISVPFNDEYAAFLPQKQSTNLDNFTNTLPSKIQREPTPFVSALAIPEESTFEEKSSIISPTKRDTIDDRCNFAKLELAANSVANDIFITSLELPEENEHFVSAESEVFHDPTNFDFLLSKTPRKNTKRNLRDESLYVKFDPFVPTTSMLPQGNIQTASPPANVAHNGDSNTTIANIGTPKRNPAIAAIDRLLFYSPMAADTTPTNTNTTLQKTNDAQEKLKPIEETTEETINMAKELELVRTTVLQLEEQLEKLKIDHDEALEKQTSYKDKINQLQSQLAQEIKNKNEITVVVDEYEISISRLVAERERDRKNLDLEKAKLQEELAAAKHHLDNTEAAFNDVHLKYERLKGVVATYRNNENALKESLQENVEIIKSLENRYEQVKSHATARLEKANQDLDAIRKQNESETVRLHAMLRKAELKSNSLAELVEQKTKENKELAQILDELIARVGRDKLG